MRRSTILVLAVATALHHADRASAQHTARGSGNPVPATSPQPPYDFVPRGASVAGVPIASLDQNWKAADALASVGARVPKGNGAPDWKPAFESYGDFNSDGYRDRALVGIYRTHDNRVGEFLLILSEDPGGSWTPSGLLQSDTQGPETTVLVQKDGSLNWIFCNGPCDFGAKVVWTGKRFDLDWARSR